MKLHEIKTADEKLPFDLEVALTLLHKGDELFMRDPSLGNTLKRVREARFLNNGDIAFNLKDPDASLGERIVVYPKHWLGWLRLHDQDGKHVLVYSEDPDAAA